LVQKTIKTRRTPHESWHFEALPGHLVKMEHIGKAPRNPLVLLRSSEIGSITKFLSLARRDFFCTTPRANQLFENWYSFSAFAYAASPARMQILGAAEPHASHR